MKKTICIVLVLICLIIIVLGSRYFLNNKDLNINAEIIINEYWNDQLAGKRAHEDRCLIINTQKRTGKVTYLNENDEHKETKEFKIRNSDISKILELVDNGTKINERKSGEAYTVYKIEINNRTTFVDSKEDKENVISKLFVD